MELIPDHFFSSLLTIILIDLVLAGDNAIVIALAARNLPKDLQTKAIFWGTFGAIAVRTALTAGVIFLLKLPAVMLVGGLLLIPIAWKLLSQGDDEHHDVDSATGFWAAIRTIVVADALMGMDNVLGIAGAAKGHLGLVIIGLLISVPLIVWGSTLILRLIKRFPIIIFIGAGAIAWTAARMITQDVLVKHWFDSHEMLRWVVDAVVVVGVMGVGWWLQQRTLRNAANKQSPS